ncbi:MAG: ATP-binding protein [Deltaproteobacteria bacterium]|jgi:hypothetical protein|nr:ATP-binding protein [Deltaproteobacteria bacterium]
MSAKQRLFTSDSSSFEEIRGEGFLYVDKTEYIHNLLTTKGSKNWFLARPRRFGKTMFIDTLEQLFLGNAYLFNNLYIHSKGYDFEPYPVLRLNMARRADSTDALNSSIIFHLSEIAAKQELALKSQNPGDALEGLIYDFQKKYDNQRVVVLIDEYDKPILDHINKPDLAMEIRDTLRDFYVALKNVEKNLHFVFVTGISKFAKTAIHSALNNLKDITHLPLYAGICGFTKTELIDNFYPLFDNILSVLVNSGILKKGDDHNILVNSILDKYNGYSWDGETKILNPYSINNCFSDNKLDNYWWDTGPPLLLEHAMSQNPTDYLEPNWSNLLVDDVDKTEIGDLRPVSVLFQTGYLTIDTITTKTTDIIKSDGSKSVKSNTYYSLKIPNDEVLGSYKSGLFKNIFPLLSDWGVKVSCRDNITNSIKAKNATELTEIFQAQLARIPYTQHSDRTKMWKYEPKLGEFFFQAVFLSFLDGLGLRVIPEPMSSRGRSDIDIFLDENIYVIFELKYIPKEIKEDMLPENIYKNMDKKADEAIAQVFKTLQDKKYKNQASQVLVAGLVVYDKDIVYIKFANNMPHCKNWLRLKH